MPFIRVVGSESLPCGCFVGYYETYGGKTVQVVEEQGTTCSEPTHRPGSRVARFRPELLLVAASHHTGGHGPASSR